MGLLHFYLYFYIIVGVLKIYMEMTQVNKMTSNFSCKELIFVSRLCFCVLVLRKHPVDDLKKIETCYSLGSLYATVRTAIFQRLLTLSIKLLTNG